MVFPTASDVIVWPHRVLSRMLLLTWFFFGCKLTFWFVFFLQIILFLVAKLGGDLHRSWTPLRIVFLLALVGIPFLLALSSLFFCFGVKIVLSTCINFPFYFRRFGAKNPILISAHLSQKSAVFLQYACC